MKSEPLYLWFAGDVTAAILVVKRNSLRSKRFQSSYCAKGRAEAKKRLIHFFLLLPQLLRRTSRGNACYAGYKSKSISLVWEVTSIFIAAERP